MTEGNHEKIPVRLVETGIWTRDLPIASLVRYHGATSLGAEELSYCCIIFFIVRWFIPVKIIHVAYMDQCIPIPFTWNNFSTVIHLEFWDALHAEFYNPNVKKLFTMIVIAETNF